MGNELKEGDKSNGSQKCSLTCWFCARNGILHIDTTQSFLSLSHTTARFWSKKGAEKSWSFDLFRLPKSWSSPCSPPLRVRVEVWHDLCDEGFHDWIAGISKDPKESWNCQTISSFGEWKQDGIGEVDPIAKAEVESTPSQTLYWRCFWLRFQLITRTESKVKLVIGWALSPKITPGCDLGLSMVMFFKRMLR